MPEKTFFMVKPDGVARGLAPEIFKRLQNTGLIIEESLDESLTIEEAAELYSPHLGKSFYDGLIRFITCGPVIVCVVSGDNAISRVRELMGATDPLKAAPGTIRGDLKEKNVISEYGTIKNLVHGSDSIESAKREIAIFFKDARA